MKHHVYIITCSVDGKKYVGKTCRPTKRWASHRRGALKGAHYHLHRAMQYHGIDQFSFTIVESYDSAEAAYDAEKALILKLREEGDVLYNHNSGGAGKATTRSNHDHAKHLKKIWADDEKRSNLADAVKDTLSRPEIKAKLGLKGIRHHKARFTEEQIYDMRDQFDTGTSIKQLALQYETAYNVVSRIVKRQSWTHLPTRQRPES